MPDISKSVDVTQDIERLRILKETEDTQRKSTSLPLASLTADTRVSEAGEQEQTNDRATWFASFVDKPLGEFLCAAYQFNEAKREDYEDGWKSDLFWFTWLVRGHADFSGYIESPKKSAKLIERYLASWSEQVRRKRSSPPYGFDSDSDAWYEWFGLSRADAVAEFCDVWEKSRYMPGHGPIEQAVDASRRRRLVPSKAVIDRRPVEENSRDETDYSFFLSIAGHLQTAIGHQTIKLPCHKLATVMGVSAMTISRYRKWAIEDGYLILVKEHNYRSKGKGEATEFRFATELWTILDKKM